MVTVNELLAQIYSLQSQLSCLEKRGEFFKKFGRLIVETIILIILIQSYFPLKSLSLTLGIVDGYVRLIATSWPAVVLVILMFFLIRYKEPLSYLLQNSNFKTPWVEVNKNNPEEQQKAGSYKLEEKTKEVELKVSAAGEKDDPKKELEAWKSLALKWGQERIFERIYNSIFGSQIRILNRLAGSQNGSALFSEISPIYIDTLLKNEVLKAFDINRYLGFLRNSQLINFIDPLDKDVVVEITQKGRDFLSYLSTEHLSLEKPL